MDIVWFKGLVTDGHCVFKGLVTDGHCMV